MTTSSSPIPFSKNAQSGGCAAGLCIARPALIADMNRVKFSYSPYNVNAMTQAAGAAAISDDAYFADVTAKVIAERTHTTTSCAAAGSRCLTRPQIFVRDHGPYALCGNF